MPRKKRDTQKTQEELIIELIEARIQIDILMKLENEYRKAINQLKTSRANLTALIESTDDVIASFNRENQLIAYNNAFAWIIKQSAGVRVKQGMSHYDFLPKKQHHFWDILNNRALQGEKLHEVYSVRLGKNELRHYEIFINPMVHRKEIIGYTQFSRNITQRKAAEEEIKLLNEELEKKIEERTKELRTEIKDHKKAEKALKKSEETAKVLINTTNDIVALFDRQGIILAVNSIAAHRLGKKESTLIGKNIFDYLDSDVIKILKKRFGDVAKTKKTMQFETIWLNRVLDSHIYPLLDDNKRVEQFAVYMRDITEQLQMEKTIVNIRENERRLIGMNLHDNLSHDLLGIAIKSKLLSKKLADKSMAEAGVASEIEQQINRAIQQTKNIAHGLFPVSLEDSGLPIMAQELKKNIETESTLSCLVNIGTNFHIADIMVATHLYYIMQEAVHNAVRHAQAKKIIISLNQNDKTASLIIKDNGRGISPHIKKNKGAGIKIMQYRAKLIGGSFEIRSSVGKGTEVICRYTAV